MAAYLEIDEFSDTVNSLEAIAHFLTRVEADPHYWKWVIIGLHSALQSASVCLLTQTDGTGALRRDGTKKLIAYHDKKLSDDVNYPDTKLAPLSELLRRLPEDISVDLKSICAPYPFDKNGDMKRLYDFRDQFSHFSSLSWSLELRGLPRIALNATTIIRDICCHSSYKRHNRFLDLPLEQSLAKVESSLRSML